MKLSKKSHYISLSQVLTVLILVLIVGFTTRAALTRQTYVSQGFEKNRGDYSFYIVKPILFVPRDQTPDKVWLTQLDKITEFIQAWFAVRLEGKTFTYVRPTIFRSPHPLSWFWECHKTEGCTGQITYYNVAADLAAKGYAIGSSLETKQNLLVLFQGEVKDNSPFLGGTISGPELFNISFIAAPNISALKNINIFNLDVDRFCPFEGGDCDKLHLLFVITHELTHTFGLSHPSEPNNINNSIISSSGFPHVSFSLSGTPSEMEFILNSPFINYKLANIPSPLSKLTQVLIALKANQETIISFPLKAPGRSTLVSNLLSAIGFNCSQIKLYTDGSTNPNEWRSYPCTGGSIPDSGYIGQGVSLTGNKDAKFMLYGIVNSSGIGLQLKKGWNFAGPNIQNYKSDPVTAFSGIKDNLILVYYYDPQNLSSPWKLYDPKAPPYVSTLTSVQSAKAYFINLSADSIWSL